MCYKKVKAKTKTRTKIPKHWQIQMALDQLKEEIALEFGIELKPEGYNPHLRKEDYGKLGGQMVKKLTDLVKREFMPELCGDDWKR